MSDHALGKEPVGIAPHFSFAFSSWGDQVTFSRHSDRATSFYFSLCRSDKEIDSSILLASEEALREVWDSLEEDEAWKDL